HHPLFRRLAIELGSPYRQPHIILSSFAVTQRLIEHTDCLSLVFEEHTDSTVIMASVRSWPSPESVPPLAIDVAWRFGWQAPRAAMEFIGMMRAAKRSVHSVGEPLPRPSLGRRRSRSKAARSSG